jgi:alpha-1,3-rhamnosyl/mannosyltransferase
MERHFAQRNIALDVCRKRRMKLVLSIDPVRFPLTGIGRYAYELAKGLARSPEIETLRFLREARLVDALPEPSATPPVHFSLRQRLLKNRMAVAAYRFVMPRLKARALRGLEDHVFHGPNFYLPPFAGKSVVTVHDLSVYHWPQCHPPERVRFMRAEIELSLRRADLLITDSEFTRLEVAREFDWPLSRIHVTPLASSPEFHPRSAEDLAAPLARFALVPGAYTLFAGTIEPRKNIVTLLEAYARLPLTVRQRWPLLLVGYQGWNSQVIHEKIIDAERQGWARYLGYVSAEDLPILFAGARLFAFPSLYEGFGLPVLEAMASGIPVVCSNHASLPEVAGEAAAMCAAEDVEALSAQIERGLVDEAWRNQAREKGFAQAARFSWQRCVEATLKAYRAASTE